MIQVHQVLPQGREVRPLKTGWGAVHWLTCLPMYVPVIGMVVLTIIAAAMYPDTSALGLTLVLLVLLWCAAVLLSQRSVQKARSSAPASGMAYDWTFDESGVGFTGPLTSSRYRWEAIKAVLEEKDRLVVLISIFNNPILPKRQLTDDQLSAIRTLIAEVTASGRLGAGVD